jgi:4-hydroxybenzoate polyprenyltransferase
MSFSFIVNTLSDKDVDKYHNGRSKDMNLSDQPLVTKEITEKKAISISLMFFFLSLLFAFFINFLFFILIFIVDFIGYFYSMPPFRFKIRPFSDILCNSFAGSIIFIAGLSIGGNNMNLILIISTFFMASIFYIPTVVTDYEFDKKAGLKTSAVFFGPKRILLSMYPLTTVLIILMVIVFLISNIEIKVLSIIIIIYSLIFTLASNNKLKKERLYLHANWILIPFAIISLAFVIYGIFKLLGWLILPIY